MKPDHCPFPRTVAWRRALGRCVLALGTTAALQLAATAGAGEPAQSSPHPATNPSATASANPAQWWRHAVIYEIYPRSFQDTDGDGIGDLAGITRRLDYLQSLGVDAIWIAPAYPSPQVDFGYDISDYRGVDPQYGSLADMDQLIGAARARGMHVLLDMVLNHTSDHHPWFVESASSRDNPRADWYVWNAGLDAGTPGLSETQRRNVHEGRAPPNNWVSLFGGSAWEWVPARHEFYYHRFYRQQPDLNWRNPRVEEAMFSEMRFWLDRGVAGFRLDAITALFEDPQLRSSPETGGRNAQGDPNLDDSYIDNLPEVHAVMRRLRAMMDSYPEPRILLGETWVPRIDELDRWYGGAAHDELHLAMDMRLALRDEARFTAPYLRRVLTEEQTGLHGSVPVLVFDNHDKTRSIDRFGDGRHDKDIARAVAAVLYLARGTALTYYGAELGMRTMVPTRREDVRDPIGITGWPEEKGRDGERTPMQWTPGPGAGFSESPRTWLPIPANHEQINVESELADPTSLLRWTQALTSLRRVEPALAHGATRFIDDDDADLLVMRREAPGGRAVVIAINLGQVARRFDLQRPALDPVPEPARMLLASPGVSLQSQTVLLPPYGVAVLGQDPAK